MRFAWNVSTFFMGFRIGLDWDVPLNGWIFRGFLGDSRGRHGIFMGHGDFHRICQDSCGILWDLPGISNGISNEILLGFRMGFEWDISLYLLKGC